MSILIIAFIALMAINLLLLYQIDKKYNQILKEGKYSLQDLVKAQQEGETKGLVQSYGIVQDTANFYGSKSGALITASERIQSEIINIQTQLGYRVKDEMGRNT